MKTQNILAIAAGVAAGYFLLKPKQAAVGASLTKNRMGFVSMEVKMPGMRKAADWTVYPYNGGDTIVLQSSTRIMEVNLRTGKTILSKAFSSGAYFHHLNSFAGATEVLFPAQNLIELQEFLWNNAGKDGGSSIISWENKELFS